MSRTDKPTEGKRRLVVVRGRRERGLGRHRLYFGSDGNVLELVNGDGYTTL